MTTSRIELLTKTTTTSRTASTKHNRLCCRRCILSILLIIIAGAVGTLVYVYFWGDETLAMNDLLRVFDRPDADAFGGNATEPWFIPEEKQGLDLTVVNALTDDWAPFFYSAVKDWGDSDALNLQTVTHQPDTKCEVDIVDGVNKVGFIDGVIKVCNANFGKTGWAGLNTVLLSGNGYIVASVARMNEYYLGTASDEEKQFTMCHEIGHGFGIADADTNHDNDNLGTCMDYTSYHRTNQHPNQHNFEVLESMYGRAPDGAGANRDLLTEIDGEDEAGMISSEKGAKRAIISIPQHHNNLRSPSSLSARPSWSSPSVFRGGSEWQMRSMIGDHAEVHEMDLGEGMKIRNYVLLKQKN